MTETSKAAAFIRDLAAMPADVLVQQYIIMGESGQEQDTDEGVRACERGCNMIEAIGLFRFGVVFGDLLQRELRG